MVYQVIEDENKDVLIEEDAKIIYQKKKKNKKRNRFLTGSNYNS